MLTAEVLASRRIEDVFMQSEYVRTVAVVVPSKEKGAFLAAYESFHAEAVTLKADAGMKKPSGNTGAKSMAFTVVTPQIEGADQNVDGRRLSVTVKYSGATPTVSDLKLAVEEQHGVKW